MITVSDVSKKFKLYSSPSDRLKEVLLQKKYHREFLALDKISFEVQSGLTLGIIGPNGAGKSTLLKILSGILIPDEGSYHIDGKVTGLLELGTGFNYEMSGLENISMNGILIGMSLDEIDNKRKEIIDFAELGEFIDEPLKTYSSGMIMRLAFSIAIHADPTCFLVDEALAVGDAFFQQKCIRKLKEFQERGGSIIFVSHNLDMVISLCDTAILLDKGKIVSFGTPKGIVDLYISMTCQKTHRGQKEIILQNNSSGGENHSNISTNEIEFLSIQILNSEREVVTHISSEELVIISFIFQSNRMIDEPVFGILIRNRLGMSIFGTNTYLMKYPTAAIQQGVKYEISFRMKISLQPDDYLISIAIDNRGFGLNSFEEYLLRLNDIALLKVIRNESSSIFLGIIDLHPHCQIIGLKQN